MSDLGNLLRITAVVGTFHLLVFGLLWKNIQVATLRYEISELKNQKKEKYLELERLKSSVARYYNAENLERLYKQKYGYVPMEVSQKIVTVRLGTTKKKNEF